MPKSADEWERQTFALCISNSYGRPLFVAESGPPSFFQPSLVIHLLPVPPSVWHIPIETAPASAASSVYRWWRLPIGWFWGKHQLFCHVIQSVLFPSIDPITIKTNFRSIAFAIICQWEEGGEQRKRFAILHDSVRFITPEVMEIFQLFSPLWPLTSISRLIKILRFLIHGLFFPLHPHPIFPKSWKKVPRNGLKLTLWWFCD